MLWYNSVECFMKRSLVKLHYHFPLQNVDKNLITTGAVIHAHITETYNKLSIQYNT